MRLGKAIGLDLKLITADEVYHDKDGSFFKGSGVHLVKPPSSKVTLPANVDAETLQVKFDSLGKDWGRTLIINY